MRDPNRIPIILKQLEKEWKRVPDWRLGQLIVNAVGNDPFYVEDAELIEKIKVLLR